MHIVNFWPIIIASIAAFAIGSLWYSPLLFGKQWMVLMKIGDKEKSEAKARGGMWKLYTGQFVATFIMFCILAFIAATTRTETTADGAFLGFLAWLGFVAPVNASSVIWENKPWKLALISTGATLLTLVIGGAVIGAWK